MIAYKEVAKTRKGVSVLQSIDTPLRIAAILTPNEDKKSNLPGTLKQVKMSTEQMDKAMRR